MAGATVIRSLWDKNRDISCSADLTVLTPEHTARHTRNRKETDRGTSGTLALHRSPEECGGGGSIAGPAERAAVRLKSETAFILDIGGE